MLPHIGVSFIGSRASAPRYAHRLLTLVIEVGVNGINWRL